jgi:hypothetical protein
MFRGIRYNTGMLETIRELMHKNPFDPFRIVLTSGDKYDVLNPDLIALGESSIFYCFPRSDRWAQLRLNQIAAVEAIHRAA